MISNASDNSLASGKLRLVILVFKVKEIVYSGIDSSSGVGMPPVHFSTTSPTSSARPSALTSVGMVWLALQESPATPGEVNSQLSFK